MKRNAGESRILNTWFWMHRPAVLLAGGVVICIALLAPWSSWVLFSDDDGHLIQLASQLSLGAPYVSPSQYQLLSIVHFTPVAISLYQFVLALFGAVPSAFMALQWMLFGLLIWLLAMTVQYRTGRLEAAFLLIVLVMSITSMTPMLTRFYTLHYVFGGVCAAAIGLGLVIDSQPKGGRLLLGGTVLALAFLSKEIYLMLVPPLLVYGVRQRHFSLILTVLFVSIAYVILRVKMLGVSSEGRSGQSFLNDLLLINRHQWQHFIGWYVRAHAILILASLWALWLSPRKLIYGLFWASWLVLPVLAAPHGFRVPEQHADRLFFAFDLAWALVLVLAVYEVWLKSRYIYVLSALLLVLGLGVQWGALNGRADQQQSSMAYQVTAALIEIASSHDAIANDVKYWVSVPPDYMLGGLSAAWPAVEVSPNCQQGNQWQQIHADQWRGLNHSGRRVTANQWAESCQTFESIPLVHVIQAPQFNQGLLSWQLEVNEDAQVGVFLPQHHLLLPISVLRQRLVRPFDEEQYQIFVHQGTRWWFSPQKPLHFIE